MRLALSIVFLTATLAHAELPSIRFDRLAPLGGAAGTSVDVEITGADIEEVKTLLFDHPGLTAVHIKERTFKISIAAGVPEGTYDVRLVGKYGVSNPRLFAVSHGLSEVAEKEPNDDIASAQPIAINTIVNGVSDSNREDVFKFPLRQGQRIVVECQAQKLDSPLDATLTLFDAAGKQLASNGDWFGRDPLIDHVAATTGDYFVSVADLSYRSGFPYRLLVTDRGHVENVFPRALQVGKLTPLSIFGRNLGPGAKPSIWKINELPIDELQEMVTAPADLLAQAEYRFQEHPTTHSVLPTAATCTLTGFQVHGVPVLATDMPVTLEVEPNDDPKHPQKITLPAVVSGRFDRERDADWYEFETTEDGPYAFEVYSERIAGRADPYLVVVDDKDARIAEFDDFGQRVNAFDGHLRDPSGMVNLVKKRSYRVLVQDRYRRGGARFQYVLTVHKAVPDFFPAVIHHQNPGPAGTTIRRGGVAALDVVIQQKEGFNGPITLTAEGLPPGLHSQPTTITNDSRGTLLFWADANAPEWTGVVKLFATGKRGDTVLRREVRPYTRVWQEANIGTSRPTRDLVLAIRETTPFALHFAEEKVTVEAGKKVDVKLNLERVWPEVKNSVTTIPLSLPGFIKMATGSIPDGKTETTVTFDVQPNAAPGEYLLAVQGQAQVPFSKDPKIMPKPNTLVSQPSRPLTFVVLASKKK